MAEFDVRRIIEASLAKKWGVDTYTHLMREISRGIDVSKDAEFQHKFTGFYRLRRNETWLFEFYNLFEQMRKSGNATFLEIVTALKERTGQVETSFSSKMLNTLKPEMPIWDKNVCQFFDLSNPYGNLEKSMAYYGHLLEKFHASSESPDGQKCVDEFDLLMPSYSDISRTKKLDFFVWAAADING